MKNKWKKRLVAVCILVFGSFLSGYLGKSMAEESVDMETSSQVKAGEMVKAGGFSAGLYLETKGVLVLNTQSIENVDGEKQEPAKGLVKAGDYIIALNGEQITDKETLTEIVDDLQNPEVTLELSSDSGEKTVTMQAVECEADKYKLGIWVRDNVQGLGTITYLTEDNSFGALGHGIHDIDTGVLLEIRKGSLYRSGIRSIVKGKSGYPGSMEGVIVYSNYNKLGSIGKNTDVGIFGKVENSSALTYDTVEVPVASKEEIHTGEAFVRCSLGEEVREYTAEIIDIDSSPAEVNKGIILQITDEELLRQTGGIVQGMSGSPIMQDGKLIGAVTHVFVDNPTMGYGIFIENMLEQ